MKYPDMTTPGIRNAVMLFCTFLLLSGCAQINSALKEALGSPIPVLQYYQWAETLTESEVNRELNKLRQQGNIPAIREVQRAILLSELDKKTDGQYGDIINALNKAIDAADKYPGPTRQGYQQFARVWKAMLVNDVQQRRKISNLNRVLDETRNQVRILQEKNKSLLEQIEAIKSIEQQINRREESNK